MSPSTKKYLEAASRFKTRTLWNGHGWETWEGYKDRHGISELSHVGDMLNGEPVYTDKFVEYFIASLLSSELSLAVKGLREAVAGADKDMCVTGTEEGARAASTMNRSMERHLKALDSKAKEILGESS